MTYPKITWDTNLQLYAVECGSGTQTAYLALEDLPQLIQEATRALAEGLSAKQAELEDLHQELETLESA